MLRLLMLVSGAFEALFGLSALLEPALLIGALGTESNEAAIFLTRILGAATLGIGVTALLARDHADTKGGLAAACGLALYNVLAAALILWTAAVIGLGDAVLWGAGVFHALIGLLFVYALAIVRRR
jgi:hypothetical protein